jgi:hypothetical protein
MNYIIYKDKYESKALKQTVMTTKAVELSVYAFFFY